MYETRPRGSSASKPTYETRPRKSSESTYDYTMRNLANLPSQIVGAVGMPGHYAQEYASEGVIPSRQRMEEVASDPESVPFLERAAVLSPWARMLNQLPTPTDIRGAYDRLSGYPSLQKEEVGDWGPTVAGLAPGVGIGAALGGLPGAAAGLGVGLLGMGASHLLGGVGEAVTGPLGYPRSGRATGEIAGMFLGPKAGINAYNKMFNRPSSVLPPEIERAAKAERLPQEIGYEAEQNAIKSRHAQEKFEAQQIKAREEAQLKAKKLAEEERIQTIVPKTEEGIREQAKTLENEASQAYDRAKAAMEKTKARSTKVDATDIKNVIDSERKNAYKGAPTKEQGNAIVGFLDLQESELFKHPKNAVTLEDLLEANGKMNTSLFDASLPPLLKKAVTKLRNETAKTLRGHAAHEANIDTWGRHWLEGQDKWMEKSKLTKSIPEEIKQSRIQVGKEKIKAKTALHEEEVAKEAARAQKEHELSQKQVQELFESKQREHESKREYDNRIALAQEVKNKGVNFDDFHHSFWSPLHFVLKNGGSLWKFLKEGMSSKSQNAALRMVQEEWPEIAAKYKRAGQLYDHGKPAELVTLLPVLNSIVQEKERRKRK